MVWCEKSLLFSIPSRPLFFNRSMEQDLRSHNEETVETELSPGSVDHEACVLAKYKDAHGSSA